MLVRVRNPMRDLTREQKIGIGIGVGAVIAIAGIAIAASASEPEAPRKAITIEDGCSGYTIHNLVQVEDGLREIMRKEAKRGPIDPLDLTRRYIASVSKKCPTYPGPAQLPMIRLYAAIYMMLLNIMQQEGMITADEYVTWHGMLVTWAAGQGVSQEDIT